MNVSPRTLKKTTNSSHKRQANKLLGKVKVVTLIIMILTATFAIINYRVALNEKINRLERQSILETERVKNLELEIEHLEVKRAKLRSWSHIREKLGQFKINLQLPRPGQVIALNVIGETPEPSRNIAYSSSKTAKVASR